MSRTTDIFFKFSISLVLNFIKHILEMMDFIQIWCVVTNMKSKVAHIASQQHAQ